MSNKNEYPIDFVVLWVDGSDEQWLRKKKKYNPDINIADEESRYRDWGIFKYWFRAVEKYTPWVNHIYLVTDNQKPEWINEKHQKLTIIDHDEIIDKKYLPTFNSQAIEMNIHKIPGLSEHFVYFNDDMYIGKTIKPTEFFVNGTPVEAAILNSGTGMDSNELYARTMFNDIILINRNFNKKKVINGNLFKWLNPKYGIHNIRTISQLIYPYFTGYKPLHMPAAMTKKTFKEIWAKEKEVLEKTTSHKFRHPEDVNQYIFSLWNICNNNFCPKNTKRIKYISMSNGLTAKTMNEIMKEKYALYCINDDLGDGYDLDTIEEIALKLDNLYSKVLPEKSLYEK